MSTKQTQRWQLAYEKLAASSLDVTTSQQLAEALEDTLRFEETGKFTAWDASQTALPFHFQDRTIWSPRHGWHNVLALYADTFHSNENFDLEDFSRNLTGIAIDVGANEGYYAMRLAEQNPDLTVHAFEPNPYAHELLIKNLESNHLLGRVIPRPTAVSDEIGQINFQVVKEVTKCGAFDMNACAKPWLDFSRIEEIVVAAVTLDSYWHDELKSQPVELLKIDVEGAEMSVLHGAKECIQHAKRILVECHSHAIQKEVSDTLVAAGFTLTLNQPARLPHIARQYWTRY